jgi:predicted outer membrane repeat protein
LTFGQTAVFLGNSTAGSGGAIGMAENVVTLNDAIFSNNVAGADGGAIFNNSSAITLNVGNGASSVFYGNTANGVVNAIHLDNSEGAGPPALTVATAGTGTLYTFDPISVGTDAAATITKGNGAGTWKLAGTNAWADSTVNINDGTVYLYAANAPTEHISVIGAVRDLDGTFSDYVLDAVPLAGVLELTTGTLTVDTGATLELGGAGSAVTVSSGGSVVFAAGSAVLFHLTADGQNGLITTNALTFNSGATVKLSLDFTPVGGEEFLLFTLDTYGVAFGVPVAISGALPVGLAWDFSELDTAGTVRIGTAPVPEPGTYALFGAIGAVALALLRRRRKK